MKPLDFLVAGELYVDLIMSGFDFWPEPGREAFASEFHREIGGGAAITACGLAKLGSSVSVLGMAGNDNGPWMMEQLQRNGVKTSDMRFHPSEPTAFTVAATMPQDRAYLTYPGANRGFPAMLLEAATEHAQHVHLACKLDLDTAAGLIQKLHANGNTVSLDVGWHEDWLADPRAVALLPLLDVFLPNETEAVRMTGEADVARCLLRLAEAGAKCVPLKLGRRGSGILRDGDVVFVESPQVNAVDTTGAGDCFDAGFLHAWRKGEPVRDCLRLANICGALSTESLGGIAGFPDWEKIHSCGK
ncbi:MAG: carbohydrate kinase family protein [Bryobacteraceae bacterium]